MCGQSVGSKQTHFLGNRQSTVVGRKHSSRVGFSVAADINSDAGDVHFPVWSLSRLLCCVGSGSNVAAALRRRSAAARLLRLRVRIRPGAWMFVCCECCVLSGRGLWDELIKRPEESYRLWGVVGCDLRTSRMRRSCPEFGCSATRRKNMCNCVEWIRLTPNTMHWLDEKQSAWPERVLCTALKASYLLHSKTQERRDPR